jgi:hypothetical protein
MNGSLTFFCWSQTYPIYVLSAFNLDEISDQPNDQSCVQVPFLTGMSTISEIRTMFAAEVRLCLAGLNLDFRYAGRLTGNSNACFKYLLKKSVNT